MLSILASQRPETRQGDQANGDKRVGQEGLGSAAVFGDSPEAHGHLSGMGRLAEERYQSVQRWARSRGQSLLQSTLRLLASPTSKRVATLARPPGTASLWGKEIKAEAGREERARFRRAGRTRPGWDCLGPRRGRN